MFFRKFYSHQSMSFKIASMCKTTKAHPNRVGGNPLERHSCHCRWIASVSAPPSSGWVGGGTKVERLSSTVHVGTAQPVCRRPLETQDVEGGHQRI